MVNNQLSVCISGKGNTEYLSKCVKDALKISREVIYIDSGSDDQSKSKARELGARIVDFDSFASTLKTEWVLFLRPTEAAVLTSKKGLYSMLNNKEHNGYLVYTKSDTAKSLLEKYQLIRTLGQYKKIGDLAYVTTIEPRLVRKAYATYCLESLITDSSQKQPDFCRKIVKGLSIKSISEDESTAQEDDDEEHDKACLKGEIYYGPVAGEGLDELSSGYIGYRVVHRGYLDSFMDGARRGFGIDRMYVPMLEYLNKNGHVAEAKDLFELWISNRDGKESLDIQRIGGLIYANLFLLDEAISWYEKAAEMYENPLAYANMGKLYMIKGDREKAVTYLKKSIDMQPDPYHEKIFHIIDKEEWESQTLSLCMIAKDEEDTIRNALESMKNIADEIVVVDTGSSDRTRDVVREYGGKVVKAEWHDDFSSARNLALQEAHGDYVFFLDADELIDIRDRMGLALFKKMLPLDQDVAFKVRIEPDKESQGLSVSLLSRILKQESVDYQVRLFPRKKDVEFEGAAFESVDNSLRRMEVQVTDAQLFKMTHKREKDEDRDRRKISAVTKSFSSIDDPAKALQGGLFFLKLGDIDQAYQWFEKTGEVDPKLLSKIAMLYTRQNEYVKAKGLIKKGLEYSPESSELNLALAEVYHKEGQYNKVRDLLSDRIDVIKKNLDPESAVEASYYYGIALLEADILVEGVEHIAYSSENNPLDTRYKIGSLYAFSKADQWEQVLEVAGQVVDEEKINIDHEIKDFSDVGMVFIELVRHFADSGNSEEANICHKILEHIIRTRISNKEEVDKMTRMLDGLSMENG